MIPRKAQVKKRQKLCWQLDFGVDKTTGKRHRKYYPTEEAADDEIERVKKSERSHGEYWIRLTPLERRAVVTNLQEIDAAGLTLGRVWQDYQTWSRDAGKQPATEPMAFAKVVEEFKTRKLAAGKSKRYVEHTADFFMRFGNGRESQPIHEIRPEQLNEWIDGQTVDHNWSLSTKRTYMLLFSSLWEVALAKGWCSLNILKKLEAVKVPGKKVEIYENETTMNIMAAIMSSPHTQKIIAPIALGFWGCMRPEEIDSSKAKSEGFPEETYFGWHDIDLKNARCKVRITKVGDERTICLQPCAVEWLKLAKELQNPLPPINERRLIDECCEMIGLKNWLRDGLRKNCATHLRAVYENDYKVVADLGNSVKVLLKWYAALHVPHDISLEHWKITPDAVRKYMKSKEWEAVLRASRVKAAEK